MPKVMGQRPGIVPIVSQLVPCRMPEHVRVNRKRELGRSTDPLNHPQEPCRGHWRPRLSHEHIRAGSLQWPQSRSSCPRSG